VDDGSRFFVRQSFPRGKEPHSKGSFLFCQYQSYGKAKEHYDVLADDPYRRLYAWEEDEDRQCLLRAADSPAGYRLYINLFKPRWERLLSTELKEKMKDYLRDLGWTPTREESIIPYFYPYFGEVYVGLKFGNGEVRVKLEEIEGK
jgi:hypothetical protein